MQANLSRIITCLLPPAGSLASMRRNIAEKLPQMPVNIWVLTAIAFLVAVGFGVVVPVLPIFAKSFNVSNLQVGAVISAFAFLRLITSPLCPRIAKLLNYKVTLGVGIFIVAASSAASGLAQNYWQLLISRSLGGIGSAMFSVSAMTIMLATVSKEKRGRAAALFSGGFLLGGMAGPAVGGIFSSISLTAPFFFYAATLTGAGIVGLAMIDVTVVAADSVQNETESAIQVSSPSRTSLGEAFANRAYRAACFSNFAAGWQSQGVRGALVPILVVEILGYQTYWTGIALACAAVIQGVCLGPVGTFLDRNGRKPLLIAAGVITGLACLATPFSPNILVVTIVLCCYGVGSAMQSTAPTAVVGDVIGTSGGQPIAVFQMTADIGAIAGPIVAGAMVDVWSFSSPFILGALLLFAAGAYGCFIPETGSQKAETVRK